MADNKFYPKEDVLVADGAKRGSAFVDFAGLDYFWSLAKQYVDTADAALAARATALETTVNGTAANEYADGLVKKVAALRTEVDALGGGEGGIQGMINAALESYSTTKEMNGAIATALTPYAKTADVEKDIETAVASEADARSKADTALTESINALSGVVGAPAEGETPASGIFGIIEENEKTTAEALTDLDGRVDTLEAAKTDLQDQITSMDAAYKKADTELTNAINNEVARATGAEEALAGRATALETTVNGTPNAETGALENGLVQKVAALEAKDTQLNTAIGTVSEALEAHKVAKEGEVSIHVSAADRTAWNGAVSKIDTFLKDADMTANAVDTLKELQDYMTSDGTAATELVNRVSAIETTVNGTENNEGVFEGGLVQKVAANAQAIVDAEAAAKKYTDDEIIEAVGVYAAEGVEASGLRKEIAEAETRAKEYADDLVKGEDGKSLFDAAGSADKAEAAAKAYTNELYGQITFVSKADIDGLFTAQN